MTNRRRKRGEPIRHWYRIAMWPPELTGCGLAIRFPRATTIAPERVTCVACRKSKEFEDYLAHRMEKALARCDA